jgi:hypothetical protein
MGTFLAIPIVLIIGVLMVFFPVVLAIVYASLILLAFLYFKLSKYFTTEEILSEHPFLRPEQIRLIKNTPIFYGYHPAAMLYLGGFVVFKFFSIPMLIILAIRREWFLLPLPVLTWILSGLTTADMEPLTAVEEYAKKSPNEAKQIGELIEETYQEVNRGIYSKNEEITKNDT